MAGKRHYSHLLPIVVYVGVIFFFSSRPYFHAPGPDFEAKDKVAHCIEYLVLGLLLFRGIGWSVSRNRIVTFLFLFTVGISIAALDELFQSYIPGRTMSVTDWLADAAGLTLGIGTCMFGAPWRRRRSAADPGTKGGTI